MNEFPSHRLIACFNCGQIAGPVNGDCECCGLDLTSAVAERRMNFVILRIATIVLALEAAILIVPLLLVLQMRLAALPIGIALLLSGAAWMYGQHLKPHYFNVPASGGDDLRNLR